MISIWFWVFFSLALASFVGAMVMSHRDALKHRRLCRWLLGVGWASWILMVGGQLLV